MDEIDQVLKSKLKTNFTTLTFNHYQVSVQCSHPRTILTIIASTTIRGHNC